MGKRREVLIADKMRDAGTYDPIYDEEIHVLAGMERDLKRALSQWKKSRDKGGDGGDFNSPLWPAVQQLRKDVLSHYDSLGLTPKGMKRLRAGGGEVEDGARSASPVVSEMLDALRLQAQQNARGDG